MKTQYIAYDAGSNIWEVEKYNESVDWHKDQYTGTKKECEAEAQRQMNTDYRHYPDAPYGSIWDY